MGSVSTSLPLPALPPAPTSTLALPTRTFPSSPEPVMSSCPSSCEVPTRLISARTSSCPSASRNSDSGVLSTPH